MRSHFAKRTRMLVALGVLTVLVFALTAQIAGAGTWSATVTGKVTDTKGVPLKDITVQPYGYLENTDRWGTAGNSVKTDAAGMYTITFIQSPTATATRNVTIQFYDYRQNIPLGQSYRDNWWHNVDGSTQGLVGPTTEAANIATHFTLSSGDALTGFDQQMKIYHVKISGKITDRAGTPLAGVYVQPYGRALNTQLVHESNGMITGADGLYTVWVEPHVQPDTWWAIYAAPRNSVAYHPRWYNNVMALLGTTMPIVNQASHATVTHFTLDSDQQATGVDISLTQNKADTLSFSYAKPKKKGSHTIIAAGYLNPSHDPAITIKAKIYKYNASKKKYVYKYTVTAKQTAAGLSTKWSLSKKVTSHGKYKVKVYVTKHLWWAHRATSASKTVKIK